ncbi:MAG: hypothetical protein ACRCXZ_00295, partial [Patescibacteria group bacterium]
MSQVIEQATTALAAEDLVKMGYTLKYNSLTRSNYNDRLRKIRAQVNSLRNDFAASQEDLSIRENLLNAENELEALEQLEGTVPPQTFEDVTNLVFANSIFATLLYDPELLKGRDNDIKFWFRNEPNGKVLVIEWVNEEDTNFGLQA